MLVLYLRGALVCGSGLGFGLSAPSPFEGGQGESTVLRVDEASFYYCHDYYTSILLYYYNDMLLYYDTNNMRHPWRTVRVCRPSVEFTGSAA